MTLDEYTRILMWTAAQGDARSGAPMSEAVEKSVRELAIVPGEWLDAVTRFPELFRRIAGSSVKLARRAAKAGRRWFHGSRHAARVFQ